MSKRKYELVELKMDAGRELTPEEIAAYEEGYQQFLKDLADAKASGDQARVEQVYEDNK